MPMPSAHVLCTIKASKEPAAQDAQLQAPDPSRRDTGDLSEGYHRALSDAVAARMIFEKGRHFSSPDGRRRTPCLLHRPVAPSAGWGPGIEIRGAAS